MGEWICRITDEELKGALNAGMSNSQIAEKYGMNVRTLSRRKADLVKRGWSPDHDMTKIAPEGFKVSGTSSYYSGGVLKGQWVKTSVDEERREQMMQEMVAGFVQELPKYQPSAMHNWSGRSDLIAVYPLGDPHIGMLAWARESGDDWDLSIAESCFVNIFDRVVRTAPACERAVIVNLGDYFHYDNFEGVTSRSGNTLDRDGRYAKMVQVGIKIMRRMIDSALEHHKRVDVINCIGNHDDTGAVFLSACLKHVYELDARVTIDDSPAPFHYIRHGKNLIGAHHGHTCKMEKLPGVMACDRSKDWGETSFRYWLTGHIHNDSRQEHPGCMVESFRTLAGKDAYATWGGWRSGRDTKVIVYHKDFGEVERHTVNIAQWESEKQ